MQFAAACLGGVLLMACSAPDSVLVDQETAALETPADEPTSIQPVAETGVETPAESVAETAGSTEMTDMAEQPADAHALCTQDYAPVCGANGETYGNACEAAAEGVDIAADGECHADEATPN